LRLEDQEVAPQILLTVRDAGDRVVRQVAGPVSAGFHRVAWDLRYPAFDPITGPREPDPWGMPPSGPMATPGTYSVQLTKLVDGEVTAMGERQSFQAVPLGLATLGARDRTELAGFQEQVASLQRAVMGTAELARERARQLELLASAVQSTVGAQTDQIARVRDLRLRLHEIEIELWGDRTVSRRSEPILPGLVQRVDRVVGGFWTSSAPTETNRRDYAVAAASFADLLTVFGQFESDFAGLQGALDEEGTPWTPGRGLPRWPSE